MEIVVKKEDISEHDTGGGYREVTALITIDETLAPRMQRHVAMCETLGILLDPLEMDVDFIDEIALKLGEVLDQLE